MIDIAKIQPMMKIAGPILSSIPEGNQHASASGHVSGRIEMDNVSFRYNERMPLVLNDLSLKINPGEYVPWSAKPDAGNPRCYGCCWGLNSNNPAVFTMTAGTSTPSICGSCAAAGVVLQDGKIFNGTIYDNIVITAPWLTLDDAWEAAELAGIAEDIRALPMGMNTMLSESSVGISGGQRQRLMIARAIAPNPPSCCLTKRRAPWTILCRAKYPGIGFAAKYADRDRAPAVHNPAMRPDFTAGGRKDRGRKARTQSSWPSPDSFADSGASSAAAARRAAIGGIG